MLVFVLYEEQVQCGPKQVGGFVGSCSEFPLGLNISFPMTKPRVSEK